MPSDDLLGSGRNADVYALDEGWVLRRYRDGMDATAEASVMPYLREHGYPVPAVRSADGPELVMQRLYGPTMLTALLEGSLTADEGAAMLGGLLEQLHAVPARLSDDPAVRILHLDLHPDNVMLTPEGPVVIDWSNTAEGSPELDWAISALILAQVAVGDHPPELAEGARAGLAALLKGREGPGDLAGARAMRAANPTMTARELEQLDEAVELVLSAVRD
ncbi:phosphotransferase [Streptomyces sp. NBC_01465]|uniref:phosphotransferase n=1 Tax=Streptomyces sp. NBC_01465 TaxID=2903878 RepID=UPI002E344986|nr:phosphotransferase [Streptomyces sp. NBC_01465]